LPRQFGQGAQAVNFSYDADHARTTKSWDQEGTPGPKTIYAGRRYEKRTGVDVNGDGALDTAHMFYVANGSRIIGQETWLEDGSGAHPQDVLYFHDDIIGSIDAVSSAGGVRAQLVTARGAAASTRPTRRTAAIPSPP
jgi:hypothetical protein